jgi:hypothetical protein
MAQLSPVPHFVSLPLPFNVIELPFIMGKTFSQLIFRFLNITMKFTNIMEHKIGSALGSPNNHDPSYTLHIGYGELDEGSLNTSHLLTLLNLRCR